MKEEKGAVTLDNLQSDGIGLLLTLIWLGVFGYLLWTLPGDGRRDDGPGDQDSATRPRASHQQHG
jgi:hypothetical protein